MSPLAAGSHSLPMQSSLARLTRESAMAPTTAPTPPPTAATPKATFA
ncbi:MAG: hypothetical protein IPG50_32630 [Myxococcales bacterium]|nr:hypothetical protein [Myxococcales bacterium]